MGATSKACFREFVRLGAIAQVLITVTAGGGVLPAHLALAMESRPPLDLERTSEPASATSWWASAMDALNRVASAVFPKTLETSDFYDLMFDPRPGGRVGMLHEALDIHDSLLKLSSTTSAPALFSHPLAPIFDHFAHLQYLEFTQGVLTPTGSVSFWNYDEINDPKQVTTTNHFADLWLSARLLGGDLMMVNQDSFRASFPFDLRTGFRMKLQRMASTGPIEVSNAGNEEIVSNFFPADEGDHQGLNVPIISTQSRGVLRLFKIIEGVWTEFMAGHGEGVRRLDLAPSRQELLRITDGTAGTVQLLKFDRSPGVTFQSESHSDLVHEAPTGPTTYYGRAILSPDGALMARAKWDCRIGFWNARTGKRVFEHDGFGSPIHYMAFSPDSNLLFVTTQGAAYLLKIKRFTNGYLEVEAMFNIRHRSSGSEAQTWIRKVGSYIKSTDPAAGKFITAAFSPDSQKLIILSETGDEFELQLVDVKTGNKSLVVRIPFRPVLLPGFSQDGRYFGATVESQSYSALVVIDIEKSTFQISKNCGRERAVFLPGRSDILVTQCGRTYSDSIQFIRAADFQTIAEVRSRGKEDRESDEEEEPPTSELSDSKFLDFVIESADPAVPSGRYSLSVLTRTRGDRAFGVGVVHRVVKFDYIAPEEASSTH